MGISIMKKSRLKTHLKTQIKAAAWGLVWILGFNLAGCARPLEQETPVSSPPAKMAPEPAASAPTKPEPMVTAPATAAETLETVQLNVQPPASEVVPAEARAAAANLAQAPLALELQPYSRDELFATGSGGCGMSLWRAESDVDRGAVLFSGIGEGPQLLMKINGRFVAFERIEGSGEEFYGQFAEQRFRNLNGDIEVVTQVTLGQKGEIESVAIDGGTVTLTQNGVSQEIAVKGDAGC